jgi:hypothetical protein
MIVVSSVASERRRDGFPEDDVSSATFVGNDVGGGTTHHVDDVERTFHLNEKIIFSTITWTTYCREDISPGKSF